MAKYAKLVKRLVPRDRVKKLCQLFWQLVAKKFSTVDGEKFIFIIGRDRCVYAYAVCVRAYIVGIAQDERVKREGLFGEKNSHNGTLLNFKSREKKPENNNLK